MDRSALLGFALLLGIAACPGQTGRVPGDSIKATLAESPEEAGPVGRSLPQFEDYPASAAFSGQPAIVNIASHPDAAAFRTRLSADPEADTRFAGHYRILETGCGTACQAIWAIDLIDGSVYSLFTASSGVAYRADSRLIVMNDPAFFVEMLEARPVPEVLDYMDTYGAPEYWLESQGTFQRVGPEKIDIDPSSKRLVGIDTFCGINGTIRRAGFSNDGESFILTDTIGGFPLLPEASMYVVDVTTNRCVPGGCETVKGEFDSEDDEDAVLNRLEQRTLRVRERLGLVPPSGAERFGPRVIAEDRFAYEVGDRTIEVRLLQNNRGDTGDRKSSLQLDVRSGDVAVVLDSLDHYRDRVQAYRLGDLYLSASGASVAIVVEMKYEILGHAPSSYCRYGVETGGLL